MGPRRKRCTPTSENSKRRGARLVKRLSAGIVRRKNSEGQHGSEIGRKASAASEERMERKGAKERRPLAASVASQRVHAALVNSTVIGDRVEAA